MAQAIIFLFIANFIGGAFTPLFIKTGVQEIPPLVFSFMRFILAIITILPFLIMEKKFTIKRDKLKLLILNSLAFALNVSLFSIAIQYTSLILSQIFYAFVPVMVGILGLIFLKERFNRRQIIGFFVAFSGLIFLIYESVKKEDGVLLGTPFGDLLLFFAMLCWAIYFILSKEIQKDYTPLTISFTNFIFTIFFLILIIPFVPGSQNFDMRFISLQTIISLIGVGIFSSVIYIVLLQKAIKITGTFIASLFAYTGPFFTALTAIPVMGEKPTINLLISGLLIMSGVFYATSYVHIKEIIRSKLNG